MALTKELIIEQGKTFNQVLRWESTPIVYKQITEISNTAPVRITAAAHGVPQGWRVAVVSAKGMTQINAANSPLKDKDYHQATVVDGDKIELNDVNASEFKPYSGGGYVQYNTPVDLTGYTARLSVKDKVGGVELLRLDTVNNRIVIDEVAHTITLTLTATETAVLTWVKGVYELELVSPTGVVTRLLTGTMVVSNEITT